jgi:protein involved in polysaccharide export with SLBB domain
LKTVDELGWGSAMRLSFGSRLAAIARSRGGRRQRARASVWLALCLVVSGLVGPGLYAQTRQTADDSLAPEGQTQTQTARRVFEEPEGTLSAVQLLRLAQQRPEVMIELKRLLAARLRDTGLTVQEDGISDEALFRRISTEAEFRSAATLRLEARGYVTSDDIEKAEERRPSMRTEQGQREMADREMADEPLPDSRQGSRDRSLRETDSTLSDPSLSQQRMDDLPPEQQFADRLENRPEDRSDTQSDDRSEDGLLSTSGRSELSPTRAMRQDQPVREQQPAPDRTMTRPRTNASTSMNDRPETPRPETELLHEPAPYNLLALRDLYTQVSNKPQTLSRFGEEMFKRRGMAVQNSALDQPIGPDYVLGPGDGLRVTIWGGVSQTLARTVDPSGTVTLPEVGPVSVAGMQLGQAETQLQQVLGPQFRNAHVAVTLARLRTVRVYVVGDVRTPGAYDLNSLSSPLNALYAAGGPTAVGSLRTLRHMRGNAVVEDIDLYDFLLHGLRAASVHLQEGDTIFVPAMGPQITVMGSVKRPAIYELKNGELKSGELKNEATLDQALAMAGGVEVSGALRHISVDRVVANDHRETVQVGAVSDSIDALHGTLATFAVKDGDRVDVSAIAPWSDRAVYVEGHVMRPGRLPYHDGMVLAEVLRSNADLLPEPSERAQIVRLAPPDLKPETINFNLTDALAGKVSIALQPLDTIRITGRYDVDAPNVTVRGEVLRPGKYPLASGMTAGQLVKAAGGFTRSALLADADLASYEVLDGKSVSSRRSVIEIGDAVEQSGGAKDRVLKPGDVLTVHQVSGWNDIGASVKISGEVTYSGTYGLQEGEKLSSVLRRAGGLRGTAYPQGAILLRLQVRDLEEKSKAELIRQIETSSVAAGLGPNISGQDQTATLQLLVQQQDQVLRRLRAQQVSGRLVIHISADIASWQGTDADVEMRSGDVLVIPKRPGFVLVSGQVYNASASTYVPNKTASWYLKNAGGATDMANRKEILIVRANGSVIGRRSGGDVLSTKLDAGDTIVVPQKITGGSMFWRDLMTTAQLASSIAIPLAIAGI